MVRWLIPGALAVLAAVAASGATETMAVGDDEPVVALEARWVEVDADGPLPRDLLKPEGTTRWAVTDLVGARQTVSRIELGGGGSASAERIDRGEGDERLRLTATRFEAAAGSDAAERWLLPHRFDLVDPAPRPALELVRRGPDGADALRIESRRVGAGWLFLPSGPREVALERTLISAGDPVTRRFAPSRLVHRFIDPRAGVVLVVAGPVAADGVSREAIDEVRFVDEVLRGAEPFQFFIEQFDRPVLTRIGYGLDRGENTAVSSITPDGHATIGDLIAASSWDFSGNTFAISANEVASTTVPVNPDETCNHDKCGFTGAGARLGREDVNFDDPANLAILLSVTEREQRLGDETIWLRAGIQNEGATGGLAEGESRFCYDGVDPGGRPRPQVPLWRFANEDTPGAGFYMTTGDVWSNDTTFNCEQSVFNHVCPNSCGLFCPIWIKGCSGSPTEGLQISTVMGDGPITMPSGHTFQALMVKNVVDFCAYLSSTCNFAVQQVRTVNYFWVVPNIGTTVRLRSALNVASDTAFTTLRDTDFKVGLFPPRAISAVQATDTTVTLSWDPGLDVRRIDGYKVYWDTDSGSASDYANSAGSLDVMPGPVAFDPCTQNPDMTWTCTATVSGLAPGTEYFFTVSTLSLYTDPSSQAETEYESVVFPLSLGSPTPVPAEVVATTTGGGCLPTEEVTGVTVAKSGGEREVCWDAVSDPCVDGYVVLGAAAPQSDAGFAPVASSVAAATCATTDSLATYYLVIGTGAAGDGPWGHYGR